ncbi:CHC2 zinc finger domain-containing protein [Geopsychrobacter electrodiphilus]|uniref:CHC2 zinc finger domain-containing protein n=1 Tax=Geopsychrobacter electrodiphilus TaxID=225196 RepID=UPI00036174CB|nr:CHC2 zinc finger domain-containing protein [Geopsychrobacter electrodiphilus]
MGWAADNLTASERKQIAEGLFQVDRIYGDVKQHGKCPLHADSSASFVYHFGDDWYKCKGCNEGGDLVNLWCEVNGLDRQDLKAFKTEFGDSSSFTKPKSPTKKPTAKPKPAPLPDAFVDESIYAALPPLPAERIAELVKSRGWTPEVITRMGLREFVAGGRYKKIAMPIRDDEGRLCNIRLYQPGAAKMKIISWYDQQCHACGGAWTKVDKAKVCAACGEKPIDYGRTRLYPPPAQWKPGLLWVVEGESDLLCALSQGLNAVTQTAGAGTWTEEFSQAMKDRGVLIVYDADNTGYKGAMQAAACIANHAKQVRVLIWPELMGGSE